MTVGWKHLLAAMRQGRGKKSLATAVLGLMAASLGCELTQGLLVPPGTLENPATGQQAQLERMPQTASSGSGLSFMPVSSYAIGPQTGGEVRPGAPGGLQDLPEPRSLGEGEMNDRSDEPRKQREKEEAYRPRPGVPVLPAPEQVQLIDLSEAFRVADAQNQTIGLARTRIGEQQALLRQAQILLLPNLNGGVNWHYHSGHFQASSGEIKSRKLQGYYLGGGVSALGSSTVGIPMIWINSQLTQAIFEHQVAGARLESTRFALAATYNRTLMRVADQYLRLVWAETRLLAINQTEIDLQEVTSRTHDYWIAGQGSESDERRAEAEANVLSVNEQRLQEEVAVQAARLSRLLHLDPSVRLTTGGGPLRLICVDLPQGTLEDLILIALENRPEIKQRAAMIASNQAALRRENWRPWLPLLIFGYSAGSYGGGSTYYSVQKFSGNLGPRTDLDALAVWNWQNVGLGNLALQKEQRANIQTTQADLSITVNTIRREVTESYARLQASKRQLDLAQQRLEVAHSGYEHDLRLIKNQVNIRPIELLNSVTRLYRSRQDFITTLVSYNRAQFDLFVRLGQAPTLAQVEQKPLLMPDAAGVEKARQEEAQKRQQPQRR
jgi:outer membrane protein TolC